MSDSGPTVHLDEADRPKFCASCGAALRPGAHFCPSCGMAAPPAPGTPSPKTAAAAAAYAATPKKQAPAPPPPTVAATGGPPASSGSGPPIVLAAAIVVALAVLVGVVLFATSSDDDTTASDTADASASEDRADQGTPATTSDRSTDTSTAPATTQSASTVLHPTSVSASSQRVGANLRCTGEPVAYTADQLVDGDSQTGWGTSSGDGTSEFVTVTFAGPRHLTSVGLTPGYLRVEPRRAQNCGVVSAFPFNRFVSQVEYRFDNGTTQVQTFNQTPDLQTMPVDVVTTSVTITIRATQLPPGADDDTILSEAEFQGFVG